VVEPVLPLVPLPQSLELHCQLSAELVVVRRLAGLLSVGPEAAALVMTYFMMVLFQMKLAFHSGSRLLSATQHNNRNCFTGQPTPVPERITNSGFLMAPNWLLELSHSRLIV